MADVIYNTPTEYSQPTIQPPASQVPNLSQESGGQLSPTTKIGIIIGSIGIIILVIIYMIFLFFAQPALPPSTTTNTSIPGVSSNPTQ
mgnify:CR=1 FL=1